MQNLSNQTIQLVGAFVLGAFALLFVGLCALLERPVPDIMEYAVAVILGSFLGVGAVNGIRKANGSRSGRPPDRESPP